MAKRKSKAKPAPLTVSAILAWADAWRKRRRTWPKRHHGPIPEAPLGTTWRQVDNALRHGHRGLPGRSSLARLLAAHRGVRNKQALPGLTEYLIETWARAHHEQLGAWPTEYGGPIAAAPGETWHNINACLVGGFRDLAGGDTLPQLLGRRCGARTWSTMPALTEAGILAWADAEHRRTGRWPNEDTGPVAEAPGETWLADDSTLRVGCRGLAGGSSLARLLDSKRGVRTKADLALTGSGASGVPLRPAASFTGVKFQGVRGRTSAGWPPRCYHVFSYYPLEKNSVPDSKPMRILPTSRLLKTQKATPLGSCCDRCSKVV
jgi:hypothetical protein